VSPVGAPLAAGRRSRARYRSGNHPGARAPRDPEAPSAARSGAGRGAWRHAVAMDHLRAIVVPGPALPAGAHVVAVDLGATNVRVARVGADGAVTSRHVAPTPAAGGGPAVVAAVLGALDRVPLDGAIAVGLSACGPLDPATGTLHDPPNLAGGVGDLALAAAISDHTGLAVVAERDTNVAVLAEATFGAAVGARDVVYLTISTGIGGGVVAGGRLLSGAHGSAGELGHIVVDLDGPPCGCGARGCVEAVASGTGIARAGQLAAATARSPALAAFATDRAVDARAVAEAAIAGDPVAAEIVARARRAVVALVLGVVNAFDPSVVVIGGAVAVGLQPALLVDATDAVTRLALAPGGRTARVVAAALGDDVGLAGAAPLVAARLLDGPTGSARA
jgi:glucokinase